MRITSTMSAVVLTRKHCQQAHALLLQGFRLRDQTGSSYLGSRRVLSAPLASGARVVQHVLPTRAQDRG